MVAAREASSGWLEVNRSKKHDLDLKTVLAALVEADSPVVSDMATLEYGLARGGLLLDMRILRQSYHSLLGLRENSLVGYVEVPDYSDPQLDAALDLAAADLGREYNGSLNRLPAAVLVHYWHPLTKCGRIARLNAINFQVGLQPLVDDPVLETDRGEIDLSAASRYTVLLTSLTQADQLAIHSFTA